MKIREKTIVPRNPFAVAASKRQAGAHEKTNRSKRMLQKRQLEKECRNLY